MRSLKEYGFLAKSILVKILGRKMVEKGRMNLRKSVWSQNVSFQGSSEDFWEFPKQEHLLVHGYLG